MEIKMPMGCGQFDIENQALSSFLLAKHRFTLRAVSGLQLPFFKGLSLYDGFGYALKYVSPTIFQFFFRWAEHDMPKPFVLVPPQDTKREYQIGENFQIELVLFGDAIQHFSVCFAAIEALGQRLGFGGNKGCYRIEQVDCIKENGEVQPLFQDNRWRFECKMINAHQLTPSSCYSKEQLTLVLHNRLRLMDENQLCKKSPAFEVLLHHLLERLSTLARFYQQRPIVSCELWGVLMNEARKIDLVKDNTRWDEWQGVSDRQCNWTEYGGLLGKMTYQGVLAPFIPYLTLGEWVHVGEKTSFGLGRYTLEG